MTDKELRRLRRSELTEILYYLSRENDELREENGRLQERLDAFVSNTAAEKPAEQAQTAPPPNPNTARRQKGKKKRR